MLYDEHYVNLPANFFFIKKRNIQELTMVYEEHYVNLSANFIKKETITVFDRNFPIFYAPKFY